MKIDVTKITDWKICSKTKSIMAKPLVSIFADRTITNKFLLDTLEGKESLGDGSMVCIGSAGDVWQQIPNKLLSKYTVKGITNDGWLECEPIPGNVSNCIEVTCSLTQQFLDPDARDNTQDDGNYYIEGLWGETTSNGIIQRCVDGDFILQDRNNPKDVWVVTRKIFLNTYEIKS